MKQREVDKRLINDDLVWNKVDEHTGILGQHTEALQMLKDARHTDQQHILGQHAIINDRLQKQDERIEKIMTGIENKIENILAPFMSSMKSQGQRLDALTKFQWTIVIGGTVVGTMVTGLVIIAWKILTNHEKLSWIWGEK